MGCVLSEEDLDSSTGCEDLVLGDLEGVCHISNEVIREGATFTKGRSLQTKNIASVGTIRTSEPDREERNFMILSLVDCLDVPAPEATGSDANLIHEGFHRKSHGTSTIRQNED